MLLQYLFLTLYLGVVTPCLLQPAPRFSYLQTKHLRLTPLACKSFIYYISQSNIFRASTKINVHFTARSTTVFSQRVVVVVALSPPSCSLTPCLLLTCCLVLVAFPLCFYQVVSREPNTLCTPVRSVNFDTVGPRCICS